jgi:uncharacterized protein YbjQ (UPF0145 family)
MSWSLPVRGRLESEADRIARGGLASSTQTRLRELTRWGGFSSFLDAPEFSVGEAVGIHPVCQVIGLASGEATSGYVRVADRWKRSLKSPGVSQDDRGLEGARWQEHPQVVRGLDALRKRALGRLVKQATQLGCQAVIGIEPRRVIEPGEEGAVEAVFEFKGTAVRLDGWEKRKDPVLTLAGVSELSLMLATGVEPVGVVGGVGRIELRPGDATVQASRRNNFAPNAELSDLTQSVYEARHAALKTLQAETVSVRATGVLGLELELEHHGHSLQRFETNVFTAFALASAVRRVNDRGGLAVEPVVRVGGR